MFLICPEEQTLKSGQCLDISTWPNVYPAPLGEMPQPPLSSGSLQRRSHMGPSWGTSCRRSRALDDKFLLCPSYESVVSESRFFNLETRMRVSPIRSRSSRQDREFLTITLRLRDETEKKFPPISGIETRSRFIIFTLRLRDENENSLDLISFFETRPRILKLAIFP